MVLCQALELCFLFGLVSTPSSKKEIKKKHNSLCMFFLGSMHRRPHDSCATHIEERSVRANDNQYQLAYSEDGHTQFGCLHGIPPSTCLFVFLHFAHSPHTHVVQPCHGSRNPLCKHGSVFLYTLFFRPVDRHFAHARVGANLKNAKYSHSKPVRPAEVSRVEALRFSCGHRI